MHRVPLQPDFQAWREAARDALHAGYLPEEIDLQDATVPGTLALTLDADDTPTGSPISHPHTTQAFLDAAELVAVHRDPERWNLLYRILYRLQQDRTLLNVETDPDIALLLRLEAQVRRELHAMQAFVRFRKVLEPDNPAERPIVLDEPIPIHPNPHAHHLVLETPTPFGPVRQDLEACPPATQACEHFIAWYRPEHRILPLAAPFFAERYAILRWTILTPDASASWNPDDKKLTLGPGVAFEFDPSGPELEDIWRVYYAGLFA